jgi:hypothetical protein
MNDNFWRLLDASQPLYDARNSSPEALAAWQRSEDRLRALITFDASANSFLETLYDGCDEGYAELRLIHFSTGEVRKMWRKLPVERIDEDALSNVMKLNEAGWQCNLRIGISADKQSKDSAITHLPALWADVDAKAHGDSLNAAFMSILDAPVLPNAFVKSGGGWHVYWLLDAPLALVDDARRAEVKRILRGIARAVGGDWQACSLSNTLRLPGSLNCKYSDGRRAMVEGSINPRRYTWEELRFHFAHYAPPQPKTKRAFNERPTEGLPRLAQDYLTRGAQEGERNARLFAAACACAAAGLGRNQTELALRNRALADGLPEREIRTTINSAFAQKRDGNGGHLGVIARYEDER